MKNTLKIYERLSKVPFGNWIFSKLMGIRVPYFSSIYPLITDLRPGLCIAVIKQRRALHNHIGTVHAIALCNLCELVMGIMTDSTIKPHLRWIPRGMTVQYTKKAEGRLTGTCEIDPEIIVPGDVDIPAVVRDETGDAVIEATIKLYITEKPTQKA